MLEKRSPRGVVPAMTFGHLDAAYNDYLGEIDARNNQHVHYALAVATDARFREFLRLVGEPKYSRYALATIAKTCDISLPEWADFWRKSQLQRALAEATNAIPGLTADLIGDAATRHDVCERCDGRMEVKTDEEDSKGRQIRRPCPSCNATGTIRKPGDTHARDKLLEMTGLTGKRGGAAVVINQNFAGMGIDAASNRLDGICFDVSADDDAGA